MSELNGATIIVHCAQRVTPGAKSYYLRFPVNQLLEIIPVDLAGLGIHLCYFQDQTPFCYQRLPGSNVRMMLELGNDYLITRSQGMSQRARQVINHSRRIRSKDNFVCRCVQKIPECMSS